MRISVKRKQFCTMLVQFRENSKGSRTNLAHRIGVCTATWTNWEQGKSLPRLDQARKIADLMKIDLDTLWP